MATVVDELVVILGLDASKFTEGQKKVADEFLKLKQNAQRSTTEAKTHTDKLTDAFTTLQGKLLGLAALFIGGMGIKEWGEHVAALTNQLGRLSQQAGISAADLSAWGNVGRSLGANPGAVQSGIASLAASGNQVRPPVALIQGLGSMGIPVRKFSNGEFDVNGTLMAMSEWAQTQRARGMGDAAIKGHLDLVPGMNSDLETVILQGPAKLRAALSDMKKQGPSPEQVETINRLVKAWGDMAATADKLGTVLLTAVEPALENILKTAKEYFAFLIDKKPIPIPSDTSPAGPISGTDTLIGRAQKGWSHLRSWWTGEPEQQSSSPAIAAPPAATGGASSRIEGKFSGRRAEVASDIANQFTAAGVPASGAAAILANVQRESGFNPTLRHPDQPRWGGEAHYAHGLYQEGGAEWNRYASWINNNYPGRDWRDPRLQTQFLIQNLQKNYPKVWNALKSGNLTAGQKAMIFQSGYLKPATLHYGDAHAADSFLHNMPAISAAARNLNVAGNSTSTDNRSVSNHTQVGEINIHTAATGPYDIAHGIHSALTNAKDVAPSNTGPW